MEKEERDRKEVIECFLKVEKKLKKGEPLGPIQINPKNFCLSDYMKNNCKMCCSNFSSYSQRVDNCINTTCPNFSEKEFEREKLVNMLFIGDSKTEKEDEKRKFFFAFFVDVLLEDFRIKKADTPSLLNIVEKVLKEKEDILDFYFDGYYDERVDWKFLLLKILGFEEKEKSKTE